VGTPVEGDAPQGVKIEPKVKGGKAGAEFQLVEGHEGRTPSGRLLGRTPSGRLLKPADPTEPAGSKPAGATPPPAPPVEGPRPAPVHQGGVAKQVLLLVVLAAVGGFLWFKKAQSGDDPRAAASAQQVGASPRAETPESKAPLVVATDDLPPAASPSAWPPSVGSSCPSLELLDMGGYPVRLDAFKGKVLVVQAGSMEDEVTRQVSSPGGLRAALERAGVDVDDRELVFAQVLLHDEGGKPSPSVTQAQAWAGSVGLASWGNAFTLITDERFDTAASKAAVGKVYLVGRSFEVLQEASASELDALASVVAKELSAPYVTLCPVEDHPAVDGLKEQAEEERATARRLELLRRGAYGKLEAELSTHGFGEDLAEVTSPMAWSDEGEERLALLDRWCEASPKSFLPFLVRGRFLINYAWDARGSGWASSVSAEGLALFKERLLRSRADLEQSHELEPRAAAAAASRITVAMGLSEAPAVALEWFQDAVKAEPGFYSAYDRMHTFLLPKWHGNQKLMFEFARGAAAENADDPRFLGLIVDSHREAARAERLGESAYFRRHREELEGIFKRLVKVEDPGRAYWRWASIAHALGELDRFYALNEKAAEAGHAASQQNLAKHLREGMGMPKDVARGMRMLCRSAAQGRATAQETLGRMLLRGEFVRRDVEAGLRLYEAAARYRKRPKLELARYYLAGVAAKRDPVAAVRYLAAAQAEGSKDGKAALEGVFERRPWLRAELDGIPKHPSGFEDWYPQNIDPPYQTKYPCELTALPRVLAGLPVADQRYLNHVCAMILFITQTKLQTVRYMARAGADLDRVIATALQDYDWALARIGEEPVPEGLEGFQREILAAYSTQRAWFPKAAAHIRADRRRASQCWNRQPKMSSQRFNTVLTEMFTQVPEAKQASGKLRSAWGILQKRYAKLNKAAMNSLYHHLCASDFF
jgi:TPR repeat protein